MVGRLPELLRGVSDGDVLCVPNSLYSDLLETMLGTNAEIVTIRKLHKYADGGRRRRLIVIDMDNMSFRSRSQLWWLLRFVRRSFSSVVIYSAPARNLGEVSGLFGVGFRCGGVGVSYRVLKFRGGGEITYSLVGSLRNALLENRYAVIYVSRSRSYAIQLKKKLSNILGGVRIEALIPEMTPEERREVIRGFHDGSVDVLITTSFVPFITSVGDVINLSFGLPRLRDVYRVGGLTCYVGGSWVEELVSSGRYVVEGLDAFEPLIIDPFAEEVIRSLPTVLTGFTIEKLREHGLDKYVERFGRRWLPKEKVYYVVSDDGFVLREVGVERVLSTYYPGAVVGEYEVVEDGYADRLRQGNILLTKAKRDIRTYPIITWKVTKATHRNKALHATIEVTLKGRRECDVHGACAEVFFSGDLVTLRRVGELFFVPVVGSFSVRHAYAHALMTVLVRSFGVDGGVLAGVPEHGDGVYVFHPSFKFISLKEVLEKTEEYLRKAENAPKALHVPYCTEGNTRLSPFGRFSYGDVNLCLGCELVV